MSSTPLHATGHLTPHRVDIPFSAPGTPAGHPIVVAFIGLGNIGSNIAKNLISYSATHKGGAYEFLLFNRTKSKAEKVVVEVEERLAAHGGIAHMNVVDSVEEVVLASDIVITSMASDDAMLGMATDIAKIIQESQKAKLRIIVDTSTLYPKTTGKIDQILTVDTNTRFVASPVFGAPQAAKEAKLIVCLAGDYASKKKIAHLLVPAAGKKAIDLGGNVEKVAAFKLLGNSFIAGTIELLAETHTLAEKVGVGMQPLHDLLETLMPAPPILGYSKRILTDNFDASEGFNINGGLKDVGHMQALGTDYNVPLPIMDLVHQHLLTARALNAALPAYQQNANMDWSSLVAANRVAAGLNPFDSSKDKTGPVPE